ncbi:MAG: alpha-L-fucosidase [Planctomycetes bacterium]|nr:alpha-L-fucosidase [Planctomycetota bacterium]
MRIAAPAILGLLAACSASTTVATTATPQSPPTSQDERMAWWRQARFGMFIHWGLYAIPAGEWQGKKGYGEWIRHSAQIPIDTYAQFQPQWNPVHFDADAWAEMAAAAGMKYLVITSKHHDGFCLWDSALTDWDIGNTPGGRDILAELSAACRRHGVVFGTYHSIMDWHHDDYLPRRPWETATRSAAGADFDRFESYLHGQVTELVTNYHPAVMWFDGEWESTWNHDRGVRLFDLCRTLAPAMLVNNRVDVHRGGMGGFSASDEARGDFATPEQEIPAMGIPGVDWESCMTMNSHWGWNKTDPQWKSTATLLRNLIDIASKGGNYLLNVGPRADGTFPEEAVTRLREIGEWMDRYGESIHGTTASVFDNLDFGRCTVRAGDGASTLYLHVFDRPADGVLVLPGLGNAVTGARRLGADTPLAFERRDTDLLVQLPATDLDPISTVVAIELEGRPIVYRTPRIEAGWHEFVTSMSVMIDAGTGLTARYTLDGSEPVATSAIANSPIPLRETCTVRARTFHDGRGVSAIAERHFTKVEPAPPVEPVTRGAGLDVARQAVDWDSIPDSARDLVAGSLGTAATVSCGDKPGEHVALRFSGFLDVPETELYRFALASDDGSKLWIDGAVVVDNDGLHGTIEKQGATALAAGLHPITVVWFNKTGGAELKLRWARPGEPFVEVPAEVLRR